MTYITQTAQGRDFEINQPLNTPTKAMIFLHGIDGNSQTVQTQLSNPDPENYYMAFPNGRQYKADPNKLRWYDDGGLQSLQDIGYIAGIIDHLHSLGVTDIAIGGHSQGASTASMIMAIYPQYFVGLLAVSSYLHNNISIKQVIDKTFIYLHGAKDGIVLPEGINYSMIKNLIKFIDAGYTISCEAKATEHELVDLNINNDVISRIDYLMSL